MLEVCTALLEETLTRELSVDLFYIRREQQLGYDNFDVPVPHFNVYSYANSSRHLVLYLISVRGSLVAHITCYHKACGSMKAAEWICGIDVSHPDCFDKLLQHIRNHFTSKGV
jgi:hypothetical protein